MLNSRIEDDEPGRDFQRQDNMMKWYEEAFLQWGLDLGLDTLAGNGLAWSITLDKIVAFGGLASNRSDQGIIVTRFSSPSDGSIACWRGGQCVYRCGEAIDS